MDGLGLGIGAGANLVGGTIQSIAASMANRAMQDEFLREIQRQNAYRNQAFGMFQPALQQRGVETAREQIAQGAEQRKQNYEQIGQTQLGFGSGPNQRDKAQFSLSGQARANLGGYSDWALNQMISNIRLQDQLNKISNFAGGTAQVFPYRMQEAQHSADELAFWGSLIQSLGSGTGNFLQASQPTTQYGGFGTSQQFTDILNPGG